MTEFPSEADRLRGHEFDGIREFDNRLPNWWLWSFYLACIFSVFYWMHYHVLGTGALPTERYQQEMEAAAAELEAKLADMEVTNDTLTAMANEPAVVAKGQEVFVTNCTQCHKSDGRGDIGPNLTDNYWIHGGQPMDIYSTIVNGVVEKGMPDYWLRQLGPVRVQQVTAFVLSIKNTNLPGKEPQGEPEEQQ